MKAEPEISTDRIFQQSYFDPALALEVFRYQYAHCCVYRQWCDIIGTGVQAVQDITQIPFLPISFFKSRAVKTGEFDPELTFESSGTTQMISSRHLIRDASVYHTSFVKTFELFYGNPKDYCIIGLLPNYLEKGHSSLVKMVHGLIELSKHPESGFYLYDFDRLGKLILNLEKQGQKVLLLGVTFALMDFADRFLLLKQSQNCSYSLTHTVIMDTGGMKGRKKEMTREEVHEYLKSRLGVEAIHSEYGMTELLSQAYSKGNGQYHCPPWMQLLIRDENDPFELKNTGKGLINVIDLANIHSCSFIATDDVGWIYPDHFEIWGRLDHSDLRGCSLLVAG
ncbi:LuxE/PaaK family acyltransferase [Arachidicoccus terrestris]|uniref:LuxE/PaaK family acyltransferase n=1 Tax=Arachidicoccus terrestris TaxID=2875539 RepID=UPI001CC6E036|nr:acyl transferase [Arachidicoccus terrestris]UAY55115.1 acyl transferase [Arachidicoccus terrestris]